MTNLNDIFERKNFLFRNFNSKLLFGRTDRSWNFMAFWFSHFSSTCAVSHGRFLSRYVIHEIGCHIYAKYIFFLSLIFLFIVLKYNFIKFGPFQLCVNFIYFSSSRVTQPSTDDGYSPSAVNRSATRAFCCYTVNYHTFNLRRRFYKMHFKILNV